MKKIDKKYYPPIITIPKKCKICETEKELQIHHEIYPTDKKEIIQAIINNQIYYLCKKCHAKLKFI